MPITFAFSTHDIDQAIFRVANALQIPVLILALLALAMVIFELGSYAVEIYGRRRRHFSTLSEGARAARAALVTGDRSGARWPRSAVFRAARPWRIP